MAEVTTEEAAATAVGPFAITDRAFIPRERYYDKEFFELENERLWPRVWQMACRLEEIPKVGDYVEYSVAMYSVLVVRTGADEVKAYQNACRHRATQLALGCGTFGGGQIVCPFHGWRWSIDGAPSGLYGKEGFDPHVMDPEELRLIECQVGTWAGCVFINMDQSAPPLQDALRPLPVHLDPLRVADMRVDWWKAIRLKANWKLAIEAFMEGWHLMATHPQVVQGAGEAFPADFLSVQHSYENGHASLAQGHDESGVGLGVDGRAEAEKALAFMRVVAEGLQAMVLQKDVAVIEALRNTDCRAEDFSSTMVEALYAWNTGAGIRLPDPEPETLANWGSQWFVFPNFMLHPMYGNAISYRVRPDSGDPEHCYFEFWSLTLYPEGEEPGKPTLDGVYPAESEAWPLIPRQDFSNIERQQRGLHTPGYKAQRLARKYEDGIANLHVHLDSYLAR
ncbi:aromatic ring-hydroxylating oxygenase subunit alpha [Streptomyces fuscichromogenes]|uniref:(2Fe-2S)-binding protein n=1 Tax=Streptomyces fuscichromogenes TaxID=1324013 RepID=A0A918CNS4_9ACTN|nr:aromatic ring-hydroxylating dioxygenase subunit alpha [Streptomyces fuscichromogenes]GGM97926.1 (2Fe-2S)-binding protein [Streptomyces fuscichromogenes]